MKYTLSLLCLLIGLLFGLRAQIAVSDTLPTAAFRTETVYFSSADSTLLPIAHQQLDSLAAWLGTVDPLNVEIWGHTDNRSAKRYNERLSRARAEAVRAYLAQKGVEVAFITGRDFSLPAADNRLPGGQAVNRRAEIRVMYRIKTPAAPVAATAVAIDTPLAMISPPPPAVKPDSADIFTKSGISINFTCRNRVFIQDTSGVEVVVPRGAVGDDSCRSRSLVVEIQAFMAPDGVQSGAVSTRSNDGLLLSAGMFSACIRVDGFPANFAEPLTIFMPGPYDPAVTAYSASGQLYSGINWQPDSGIQMTYDFERKGYVMRAIFLEGGCAVCNVGKKSTSVITRVKLRKDEELRISTISQLGLTGLAWEVHLASNPLKERRWHYYQVPVCDTCTLSLSLAQNGGMTRTLARDHFIAVTARGADTLPRAIRVAKSIGIAPDIRNKAIHYYWKLLKFHNFPEKEPVLRSKRLFRRRWVHDSI